MTLSQYDWQKLLDSQRLLMHIGLPFDSMVSRSSALLSKSRMLAEKTRSIGLVLAGVWLENAGRYVPDLPLGLQTVRKGLRFCRTRYAMI